MIWLHKGLLQAEQKDLIDFSDGDRRVVITKEPRSAEGQCIWKTAGGSWFWTYKKTIEYVIIQDACGELSTVCYVCVCVGNSHNNISTYIWYFCVLGGLRKGSIHSVSFSKQMFNLWRRHCVAIHVNALVYLSVTIHKVLCLGNIDYIIW